MTFNIKALAKEYFSKLSQENKDTFIKEYLAVQDEDEVNYLKDKLTDEYKERMFLAQLETSLVTSLLIKSISENLKNEELAINEYIECCKDDDMELVILRLFYIELMVNFYKLEKDQLDQYNAYKNILIEKVKI